MALRKDKLENEKQRDEIWIGEDKITMERVQDVDNFEELDPLTACNVKCVEQKAEIQLQQAYKWSQPCKNNQFDNR